MRLLFFLSLTITAQAVDWPQWRGPNKDNKSDTSVKPVTEWSAEKNVLWKTNIPGRGHSTPIIVGKTVYLTTAELTKESQSLLALDRHTGEIKWQKVIHQGNLPKKVHRENSRASASAQWTGTCLLYTSPSPRDA